MSKVLIIAAHPDDEVLGCGVAIQRHKEMNDDVYVLQMTHDAIGRYPPHGYAKLAREIRLANESILEVNCTSWLSFPDQGLDTIRLTELIKPIEDFIELHEIDTVYTHHYGDVNKDHRLTYEATITACRPTPTCSVDRLLTYWVPSSSEWMNYDNNSDFKPNYLINAEGCLKNKIKALEAYTSEIREFPHPRSAKGVELYAKMFGMQFGMKLAEPFQVLYDRRA